MCKFIYSISSLKWNCFSIFYFISKIPLKIAWNLYFLSKICYHKFKFFFFLNENVVSILSSLSLSLSLFVSLETYVTGSVIYNDFTLDLHRESIGTSGKRIYVLSEPIVTHVNLRSLQIERNCANLPLRIIRIKRWSLFHVSRKDFIMEILISFHYFSFIDYTHNAFPFRKNVIILLPCFAKLKILHVRGE